MPLPGEDAWTLARKRGEVPPLSPVKPLKLKNHDHDHDHDHDLDICEGVSVQMVGDCMADPPLLVTQAREIEVIPANRGNILPIFFLEPKTESALIRWIIDWKRIEDTRENR